MTFPEFWRQLQSNLSAGDMVRNWTAARGYLGDSFSVISVKSDSVIVKAPNAETNQRAHMNDFELIYRRWPEYVAGAVMRKEFMTDTRVSKYTISIINHLGHSLVR